ncbi:MAG: alpha-amylase family glycosyl hydrolase [Chloroflexota bacterium]
MRVLPTLSLLLAILPLLASCGRAVPTAAPLETDASPASASDAVDWWREVVFYEIFVRSFYDSDGDGIGDFNGVTEKLDYLQDLGIGGIWLMPIHPSPSYHGYDVVNYYAVNPDYGTMNDFRRLLDEAHKRDIRVIIDLVLNHTSSQHPFFRAALDPSSPYRDWYIWSTEKPDWGNWHAAQPDGPYYYGFFCDCMPDLNYANPEVTAQMENVVHYWLDQGVDGFRLDAIKHLFEEAGRVENAPAMHDWLEDFYSDYKAISDETYTVGEVYSAGAFVARTYEGQTDHIFNFELAGGIVNSVNGGSNTGLTSAYTFTLPEMPDGDYATFLTNHDQNRVMSVLRGNTAKAKVAATLLLTAPGTPFIYYGEEIGMTGAKPDELIRTPMQWSAGANAGFTTGTPWEMPNTDYAQGVNIAAQVDDPASLLSHYRALIAMRTSHSALRTGNTLIFETANKGLFASLRVDGTEAILVLVNLTEAPISDYALSLKSSPLEPGQYDLLSLLGGGEFSPLSVNEGGKVTGFVPLVEVPAYATLILILSPIQ